MKQVFILLFCCVALGVCGAKPTRTDWWKHGLKGRVQSCRTLCYRYALLADGTRSLERGMLEYAGSAYDVDSYFRYDADGFVVEEKTVPFEAGVLPEKRIYERDDQKQIRQISVYPDNGRKAQAEKLKYKYDAAGRLEAIQRYDAAGRFQETLQAFKYDAQGNRVIEWTDEGINYRCVMNADDKCIEEVGILPEGKEFFHNYHQYDAKTGRRTRTTFTVEKKIIEVRDDPYSDNILDDGEILSTDGQGNWITMLFESDDESGSMVVREIVYY